MNNEKLNSLLKKHDLGDDLLEDENRLFDTEYSRISKDVFEKARRYANEKMAWYFTDVKKHYLLADCNRFHWMWLGREQEYFTRIAGIPNPPIGGAYGLWQKQGHFWAWNAVGGELLFSNWGQTISPSQVNYSGKGSHAV